jgi:hypothetical protein
VTASTGVVGARVAGVPGLREAWPALAGYAVVRVIGLSVLWLWAQLAETSPLARLTRADGQWLLGIAEHGYNTTISYRGDGSLMSTNVVFHPLYPMMVRALGWTGLPLPWAAILLSALAGLVAAWGLYAVGALVAGRRAGVVLSVLWGCLPHAAVESMSYAESLFTASAVWGLFALATYRWLTAGGLTVLAGLVRPTAVALIATVGLAALIAIARRRDGWRPYVASLLAPLGVLAWWGWVAHALGRIDGWFRMQGDGWGSRFDGGRFTLEYLARLLTRHYDLVYYVVGAVLVASIVLAGFAVFDRRIPWSMALYAVLLIVLVFGTAGYFHAKARLLLPAFPVLIPLAVALARARTGKAVAVLGAAAIASACFGSYLLIAWRLSP